MKKRIFDNLLSVILDELEENRRYFLEYVFRFERRTKDEYGNLLNGHFQEQEIRKFEEKVDENLSELFSMTEDLFLKVGRRLSQEQYDAIKNEYCVLFESIFAEFERSFEKVWPLVETNKIRLKNSEKKVLIRIDNRICAMNYVFNNRVNKALRWTAWGTVFAGMALLLSIISLWLG